MLQMASLGDDDVVVPIVRLKALLDVLGLPKRAGRFDLVLFGIVGVGLDRHLLAELVDDPAPLFLVKNSR